MIIGEGEKERERERATNKDVHNWHPGENNFPCTILECIPCVHCDIMYLLLDYVPLYTPPL